MENIADLSRVKTWQKDDFPGIRRVAWETWKATYGHFIPEADIRDFYDDYYSIEQLGKLFDSEASSGCVSRIDDEIVGYSKTHWHDEKQEFFITSLYVLPEYQGLGLGEEMLHYDIDQARTRSTDKVWLGVMVKNKPALNWYLKQGFVFIESRPFTIGGTTVDDLIGYKII